ncbi:acetyl-CoA carboxylase, carboxyltransferase subunit beta [Limosilactobacillus fastidiosus]|uniref:Acetyl-coenzyme A carboxylase carboxyl transferase subunit beta n=1 Tax=Limosilactobacillus fastidiosus TaxID=2759855 RepID=A0A7W3YBC3_9LACO|nr:acetyl-CoA carboxylase, carboxyltransferase subunit beta [Limosilactobacillus fastidiosus]MBB1062520.1 acetyl-CoA carboxylase carboxyltransferase subunit beta [Limosilactobacillus fastidiosus]MBB1085529.1 acetyl-CoA carboxylase carboxyltransferase subunit beta [Limosilactobacillus fastidiosus]MCD7083594.1 acetyl-CoA carboxylase, carboxyltransferase subunit beta [Limosilactobacillus fastidiosus]MCD7085982.1 acetyl-CoA carboxylase, carboxyltransferase subunit beta [Limosilactobacillus fastidio
MNLYDHDNTLTAHHIKADQEADAKVPDNLWTKCPKCETTVLTDDLDQYQTCPNCFYGFRISARQRLKWLVDQFTEFDTDLQTTDPLKFPGYAQKLAKAQQRTKLNDSVLTGTAIIDQERFGLGIMDPTFIMGSLGTITGEKITRLFERSTEQKLPVVLFTASGGARMQEGIMSLMQMAKVSAAVKRHSQEGLLYVVVLTDPTTGGVTASFAMQGDITLAEPHALIGFAGRRVIEQTMHQKIPHDLQDAETLLSHGFIDRIVRRQDEKQTLQWLLKYGG